MRIADLHVAAPNIGWSRRSGLIAAGVTVIGGFAFGWPWLVAVGVAPLLISVLPCVAMCAIGVCMMRGGSKSCVDGGNAAPHQLLADDGSGDRYRTPFLE
jgi:hypothetical protein